MSREESVQAGDAGAQSLRFADLADLGKNGWWRYGLAIALSLAAGMVLAIALVALLDALGVDVERLVSSEGGPPLSLSEEALEFVLVFASVILFLPGLWLVLPWLHRRARLTFLTGHGRFAWPRLWLSFGAAIAIFLASLFYFLSRAGAPPELDIDVKRYALFAALGILLVPLQAFTEELFFRGYLMQAVGRLTKSLALRLLVPAALFAALHLANPEVSRNTAAAIAGYGLVALYLGVLALRGNGLEEAIGFHLANNLFVLLVVAGPVTAAPSAAPLAVEPDLEALLIVEPILYGCHYVLVFALLGGLGLPRAAREGGRTARPMSALPAAQSGKGAAPPSEAFSPALWKAHRDIG